MKIAFKNDNLRIIEVSPEQYRPIRSWNKLHWDWEKREFSGKADLELLERLAAIIRLPEALQRRREELGQLRTAVDRERLNPEPRPLLPPPVKVPLYQHQTRAYNMCLLTFEWLKEEGNHEDRL